MTLEAGSSRTKTARAVNPPYIPTELTAARNTRIDRTPKIQFFIESPDHPSPSQLSQLIAIPPTESRLATALPAESTDLGLGSRPRARSYGPQLNPDPNPSSAPVSSQQQRQPIQSRKFRLPRVSPSNTSMMFNGLVKSNFRPLPPDSATAERDDCFAKPLASTRARIRPIHVSLLRARTRHPASRPTKQLLARSNQAVTGSVKPSSYWLGQTKHSLARSTKQLLARSNQAYTNRRGQPLRLLPADHLPARRLSLPKSPTTKTDNTQEPMEPKKAVPKQIHGPPSTSCHQQLPKRDPRVPPRSPNECATTIHPEPATHGPPPLSRKGGVRQTYQSTSTQTDEYHDSRWYLQTRQ
ncbi:hypothetical protein EDC01DRAFT_637058 [Geopyxis carbonaria]|nr:hypothetical protein EDC01DRAFT_637058 [Geopyxis carbonaria]